MYVILEARETAELQQLVRQHQDVGWRTCGGPFTYTWALGHGPVAMVPQGHPQSDGWLWLTFCQAMEREP